jgi:hypothetical protein
MAKKNHKSKSEPSEKKHTGETSERKPLSLILLLVDVVRYAGVHGAIVAFALYAVIF